ncbi:hypothetical protein [uncultured Lacinutrix sp.]|uniref:hypothetical protein n=1 Tax=uncultured Lacinutrix sp. TaxID=574032 RepID=UPI00262C2C49|nr:hypothetical protein [uncultured Lacinutrix sp.]
MKKLLCIALTLLLSFQVKAQDSKIPNEVKEYIQSRVENQINVGIVVGYINGDTIDYYSFGNTTQENGTPVNKESVFEIGSISKHLQQHF